MWERVFAGVGIEVLEHGCDSFFDGVECASPLTATLHAESAVIVIGGTDGSAVVESEPSGLDYSLAQRDISAYSVTFADFIEGFGHFAWEVGIVGGYELVHSLNLDLLFSNDGSTCGGA